MRTTFPREPLIATACFVVAVVVAGTFVLSLPDRADAGGSRDSTPPVRSDGAPTGILPPGTTSTTLSLKTDEAATCRYATAPGVAYNRMKNTFSTTGGTAHSTVVGGLQDGTKYTFYVRCRDLARNANADDYPITFWVAYPGDCGTSASNAFGSWSASGTSGPAPLGPAGTWKVVPSPNVPPDPTQEFLNNRLFGVDAIAADDAWAVGDLNYYGHYDPLALHWDGERWTQVPLEDPPLPQSRLFGVSAASTDDVWAVGHSYEPAYTVPARNLIEHWDGTQWRVVAAPSPGSVANELRAVAAVSGTDAWAVGFCGGTYRSSTVILHWDGVAWTRVPSPNPDAPFATNELYGVAAISADDIWAVGLTYAGSAGAYAPLALHWDGTTWTAIPTSTLNGGGYGSYLRSVSATASGDVLAVGATVFPAGFEGGIRNFAFAARWDGTAWSRITEITYLYPNYYAYSSNFYGVSAAASNFAWVVGDQDGESWAFHWDGRSLDQVHAPDLPWVSALYAVDALTADDAWAVGLFAIEGDPGTKSLTERYSIP